jgi:hypothetical protein
MSVKSETSPAALPHGQEVNMESTLDRLTKLAAQRSARLDALREACLPICRLIAPLRQPTRDQDGLAVLHSVREYRQQTNVGGCSWLLVETIEHNQGQTAAASWTIERPINASGGWTHGDFGSPQPSGPTPRQLREFAAWLADPETLKGIADLEQETAGTVDGLTASLNAAAAALAH